MTILVMNSQILSTILSTQLYWISKKKRKRKPTKTMRKKSAKTKQKPPPLKKKRTRNLFCMGQLILGMESTVEYG